MWTEADIRHLETLTTYGEMANTALAFLARMPQPIVQVCGPLTTGGLGSFEKNLEAFDRAITMLRNQGKIVFDQRPFEMPMQKLKAARTTPGYATELLEEFYLPIFESGHIAEVVFLPGWESSTGARWEHDQAERLGIMRMYLPKDWGDNL